VATISTLTASATAAGMRAPALFVIGPTIRHAATLNRLAECPLAGERLAVPAGARGLIAALEEAGAETVAVPVPITPAARVVLGARPLTGCVVRSAAEVESFDEECRGADPEHEWTGWCIGAEAAGRARNLGWRFVELDADAEPHVVDRIAARNRACPADSGRELGQEDRRCAR
jgi:uroporphyrinogen-III synthase